MPAPGRISIPVTGRQSPLPDTFPREDSQQHARYNAEIHQLVSSTEMETRQPVVEPIHSDERPHACDHEGCNEQFKRRDELSAHQISFHRHEITRCLKRHNSDTFDKSPITVSACVPGRGLHEGHLVDTADSVGHISKGTSRSLPSTITTDAGSVKDGDTSAQTRLPNSQQVHDAGKTRNTSVPSQGFPLPQTLQQDSQQPTGEINAIHPLCTLTSSTRMTTMHQILVCLVSGCTLKFPTENELIIHVQDHIERELASPGNHILCPQPRRNTCVQFLHRFNNENVSDGLDVRPLYALPYGTAWAHAMLPNDEGVNQAMFGREITQSDTSANADNYDAEYYSQFHTGRIAMHTLQPDTRNIANNYYANNYYANRGIPSYEGTRTAQAPQPNGSINADYDTINHRPYYPQSHGVFGPSSSFNHENASRFVGIYPYKATALDASSIIDYNTDTGHTSYFQIYSMGSSTYNLCPSVSPLRTLQWGV